MPTCETPLAGGGGLNQDVPGLERMYRDSSLVAGLAFSCLNQEEHLVSGLSSDRREEDGPDASVGSLDPDSIVGNLGNWRQ